MQVMWDMTWCLLCAGEGISPKRSSEGEPLAPPLPRCRPQVKVLELTHIQREYELVHARLLLLKTLPDVPLSGEVFLCIVCSA